MIGAATLGVCCPNWAFPAGRYYWWLGHHLRIQGRINAWNLWSLMRRRLLTKADPGAFHPIPLRFGADCGLQRPDDRLLALDCEEDGKADANRQQPVTGWDRS